MDGVDIYPNLSTCKVCKAAAEGINREAFIGDGSVSCRKDVIVYAACKKGRLDGNKIGREIQAQIPLEAVFRLQVPDPNLKAEGASMLTVSATLSKIGGAESAGYICPQREVLSKRTHSSNAGTYAGETAAEILKPPFKGFAVEPADIGP